MKRTILTSFALTALAAPAFSQEAAAAEQTAAAPSQASEQQKIAAANALAEEKLKAELADLRAEVTRVKLAKEAIAERLSLATLKLRAEDEEKAALRAAAQQAAQEEAALAKAKAEAMGAQLKAEKAELALKLAKIQSEMELREAQEKRKALADREPQYLENPLKEDGTLVISDRRIAFNGPITYDSAEYITERIQFFNNADPNKPIFLVIDYSPGGSVMAGYRILRAMEGSQAPVYTVVKSFAASMAATMTTLAEKSYAYPNAIILHHQISSGTGGSLNLTQQKEFVETNEQWWKRLATPIADKMGISTEEFIKMMYENSSDGDWTEFGTEAQKLKWVDHIVERIDESSLVQNPDTQTKSSKTASYELKEQIDDKGHPVMFLPRLKPMDVYWMTNKDDYYRLR